jgi:hypothetical protein
MPRVTTRSITAALEQFETGFGAVLTTALRAYSEDMRKNAAELQKHYDKIKDDPAARAAQDDSMITADGLAHMARGMRESAERGARAQESWEQLTELLDKLES